jgi:hypothetical protein
MNKKNVFLKNNKSIQTNHPAHSLKTNLADAACCNVSFVLVIDLFKDLRLDL